MLSPEQIEEILEAIESQQPQVELLPNDPNNESIATILKYTQNNKTLEIRLPEFTNESNSTGTFR